MWQVRAAAPGGRLMDEDLTERLARLEAEVAQLRAQLRNTMMVQSPISAELDARARRLLALLAPERPAESQPVRVGSAFDGGYVIPGEIAFDEVVAFGIGANCDFEEAMADRCARVTAYDHTIDAYPAASARAVWRSVGLAEATGADRVTLADAVADADGVLLVKVDVEGDEWAALAAAPDAALGRIACLVVEFHGLDRLLLDADWQRMTSVLERLRSAFALVHIHANNAGPTFRADRRLIPSILECTFVARALVGVCTPAVGPWPTPLDTPNRPTFPDLDLTGLWTAPGSSKG